MLVWYNVEASCPVCSHRLRLRELGGGVALGQDSDLLVRMEGKHTIQAAIHTCPRCRFSGYCDDFGATLPRPLVSRFLTELSPKLVNFTGAGPGSTPPPDLQYFWGYKCAAFFGRDEGELAQRLLRAYWCLRLPPSSDLPSADLAERRKLYLGGAIQHLRQATRGKTNPVHLYLLGELNRKHGEFPTAVGYFKRFLDVSSTEQDAAPKYLRLAAIKLLRAAERSDSRERTMEEIVYADSPEP
jgi:hypothetical protein